MIVKPRKEIMHLLITPERANKTRMIMSALAEGWRDPHKMMQGPPQDRDSPFIVWGQEWLAMRVIPYAHANKVPYFHIDNGFWNSARGTAVGYYRFSYRCMTPITMREPDAHRAAYMGDPMAPWRTTGEHVLLAIPGRHFGMALGINVDAWIATAYDRIRRHTDRPILVRLREGETRPLAGDLRNCWALVTHSSNVATEAVCAGIPVFVEPTSASAPVGNLNLSDLENPRMPDRSHWWASLMSQQFSLQDMRDGTAHRLLSAVRAQVDGST